MSIDELFERLNRHEVKLRESISFIPSENMISPLSRLAFLSDGYSRYYFGEKEVFGRWSFEGGSIVGGIQSEILQPALLRLGGAEFVDMRPISGLTAMTVALAAFGEPGTTVLSVPVANGGHPDTMYVASKLGLKPLDLPFSGWATVDLEALAELVRRRRPSLIYIDHATHLFPLDLNEIVSAVRSVAADTHIHVDTSHVNGLVFGGQMQNPLECGADSYGGSTHKTFPGPHKAVLFTNDPAVADRLTMTSVNMISHHHMSDVIALAVAVLEFEECGGREYAATVIRNARAFASQLAERGLKVQGADRGFTANHQVWLDCGDDDAHELGSRLFEAGLIVNPFDPLPSLGSVGIRLGLNEPTRIGLDTDSLQRVAHVFAEVFSGARTPQDAAGEVRDIRSKASPAYCYDAAVFRARFGALTALSAGSPAAGAAALEGFLYS